MNSETVEPMLIDGEWVLGDETRSVTDPENGRQIAVVAEADREDADSAVAAALRAAHKARRQPALERATALRQAAARVNRQRDWFARTIAEEGVKTIREARAEAFRCATTLRLAADEAERLAGETIPFDAFAGGHRRTGYWTREPIGVVAAITPFNDPLNLVAHKVGPALAAGNAVIVKPHSETPLSALRLAQVIVESGLSPGLLQVLPGRGDVVGDALARDRRVGMVSLTGGTVAGAAIARAAGIKKLGMELGSNAATIVAADADLDVAVPAIVSGAYWAAGQNCLHVQRLLIHQSVYGVVRDLMAAATERLRLGPKLDEQTDMGPMINEVAARRVMGMVDGAIAHGANLLTGGTREGTRVAPTLLEKVNDADALAREEVFGPITILRPFSTLEEAIAIANSVPHALQSAIFTASLQTAFEGIAGLEGGGVMVNDSSDFRVDAMPFGGMKASGIGREGVRHAVEAMSEPKVVCFRV